MMKLFLGAAAAVSIGASLPLTVLAQDAPPPAMDGPSARPGIHEQLDLMGARIDRDQAQGKLSEAEADRAHRDISHIQDEARGDRIRDGGALTPTSVADLQARIDRVRADVRWERTSERETPPVWSLDRREQWMDERIQRASIDGRLSGNENERGRSEIAAIRAEHARLTVRDGGAVSETDRLYLDQRINELNSTLRWEGVNPPPPWAVR